MVKILMVIMCAVCLNACDNSGGAEEEVAPEACETINACFGVESITCTEELKSNLGSCIRTINELDECLVDNGCAEACDCYWHNYYLACQPKAPYATE